MEEEDKVWRTEKRLGIKEKRSAVKWKFEKEGKKRKKGRKKD